MVESTLLCLLQFPTRQSPHLSGLSFIHSFRPSSHMHGITSRPLGLSFVHSSVASCHSSRSTTRTSSAFMLCFGGLAPLSPRARRSSHLTSLLFHLIGESGHADIRLQNSANDTRIDLAWFASVIFLHFAVWALLARKFDESFGLMLR